MKNNLIVLIFVLFVVCPCSAQEWMTSLDIAKKLALVQNKMILMVWEESTLYPYPILVNDTAGRTIIIGNLFEDENISPLIWESFVPVIVRENQYADLYEEIKDKRKQSYIDKFNDDSIKIMDVNGNILNVNDVDIDMQNITTLIRKYAINTEIISEELSNYNTEKNFYSAYYLASKYLDLALYCDKKIRSEIVDLSNIYLKEALTFLQTSSEDDKLILEQRCKLLKIQESLVLESPRKVIRELNKMDADAIKNTNESYVAFLYYVAFMSLDEPENAKEWKSKVSLLNLRKAKLFINLNS